VGAQATDPARLGDAETLHDLLGAYLDDTGHGLEEGGNLHLADHIVLLAFLDHLGEGRTGVLAPVLHLRAGPPGRSGLLQGSGALFGCKRREGHSRSPRSRSTWTSVVRSGRG